MKKTSGILEDIFEKMHLNKQKLSIILVLEKMFDDIYILIFSEYKIFII